MTEDQGFDYGAKPTITRDESRAAGTVLSDLREELSTPVELHIVAIPVPGRDGLEMLFDPRIEFDVLKTWMKRASSNKGREVDPLLFANIAISNTTRGLRRHGQDVEGDDGQPLTLTHRELWDMLGANGTREAIKKMYGVDGHIIQVAQKIIEEAGYTEIDLESGDNPLMIG